MNRMQFICINYYFISFSYSISDTSYFLLLDIVPSIFVEAQPNNANKKKYMTPNIVNSGVVSVNNQIIEAPALIDVTMVKLSTDLLVTSDFNPSNKF